MAVEWRDSQVWQSDTDLSIWRLIVKDKSKSWEFYFAFLSPVTVTLRKRTERQNRCTYALTQDKYSMDIYAFYLVQWLIINKAHKCRRRKKKMQSIIISINDSAVWRAKEFSTHWPWPRTVIAEAMQHSSRKKLLWKNASAEDVLSMLPKVSSFFENTKMTSDLLPKLYATLTAPKGFEDIYSPSL